MRKAHTKSLSALSSVLASLFATANAEAATQLNIDPQPVDSALRDFAQQTGWQILFRSADMGKHEIAPAVRGARSPEAALTQLLSTSNLEYQVVNSNTIAIRPKGPRMLRADPAEESRVDRRASAADGGGVTDASNRSAPDDRSSTNALPQVLIRGSRSLDADIERTRDDVLPYVVIDKKAIQSSGAKDVEELLRKRLTMSYVPMQNGQAPSYNSSIGNQSTISLRGLANAETLILIDGRRITGRRSTDSEFQADLNGIPLSAVERIEVLPASASGIYGGNATGGVVNVILRRDYEGFESNLNYQNTFDHGGASRMLSVYGGFSPNGGKTSILLSGSYSKSDGLAIGDRNFYYEGRLRYQRDQYAADAQRYLTAGAPVLGSTTNISSAPAFDLAHFFATGEIRFTAPNLVLKTGQDLGSPITSVPEKYSGVQSDAGAALLARAGSYNLSLPNTEQVGGTRSGLLAEPIVASADVTLRHQFTPQVEGFLELSVARNDQYFTVSNLSPYFTIPSTSPSNPFQEDIIVNSPLFAAGRTRTTSDDHRVLLGITSRLTHNWSVAADYSFSDSLARQRMSAGAFSGVAQTALDSGTLDLLQDPALYSPDLNSYALPPNTISPTRSRLNDASVRFGGPAFSVPAGSAVASLLAEYRRQVYGEWVNTSWLPSLTGGDPLTSRYSPGSSATGSLYGELRVPLASLSHPLFWMSSAEVQVAARFDRYTLRSTSLLLDPSTDLPQASREFSSADPSLGIRFEILNGVTIRGSFGTGFLPPYLAQIQPSLPFAFPGQIVGVDPKRGGEPIGLLTVSSGGNPALGPEKSRNLSAGIILSPPVVPGLRVSLDWTRIRKAHNIVTSLGLDQSTVDNEDNLPGVIIRDAPTSGDPFGVGKITGMDVRFFNGSRALSESFDLSLDYSFSTERLGAFSFQTAATKLVHNLAQANPLVSPIEHAGLRESPTWAANGGLTWKKGLLTLMWNAQYLAAYPYNDFFLGESRIGSIVYHDVAAQYSLERLASSALLRNAAITAGVKNVFNREPRYIPNGYFYDTWGDPHMATYFLTIKTSFAN